MPLVRRIILGGALAALCLTTGSALAQTRIAPGEQCTVQVLNRTVRVDPEGSWRLSNIPVMGNRVRARLICDDGVAIRRGEGPLMQLRSNGTYALAPIPFGPANPAPTRLVLSGVPSILTAADSMQLIVTGVFPSGPSDVSSPDSGTDYFTTAENVLQITDEGLVTPLQSGNVLITVVNQGITAAHQVQVQLGDDTDGDGLPDDWETANGLDPSDATDASVDGDADNLTNKAEYLCGTDPFSKDTDGDTLNDGEEVSAVDGDDCQTLSDPRLRDTDGDLIPDQIELITGTSPTNAASYDLDAALLELSITPSYISLPFGTFVGDSIRSVELMGVLIDGSGIDLSIHPDIAWYSYNTSVADATVSPGSIIAYGVGETTIEAGVGGHSAEVAVSVFDFTPTFLAKMNVTGDARAVSLGSGMAVVATTAGLSRITINLSLPPVEDSHLTLEGEMKDVKLQGGLAYAAGDAGFVVADVTTLELTQVGSLPLPASYVYDLDVSGGVAVVGTQNALHIIDVSTPTEPVVTATIDVAVTVMGVALDGTNGAIALGTSGIASLSIEDPLNPVLGSPTNLSANVLEVDLADGVAIVAMGSAGLATVDMSDPAAPVHLASTNGQGAFSLNDLVIEGTRVFGSDTLAPFPSLPVIGVEVPDDPVFASRTSTRSMGGFSSRSVDAKSGIFAFAGGTVVVGIYDVITDEEGVAPEVILTNPEEGALFIEGETLPMHAFATDDIMVSAVEFFVDGQSVGIRAESPYTFNLGGLVEGSVLTLHAEATDLGGNVGVSSPISVAVVADPLTTVIGRVLGPDDAPREGVSVSTLDQTITTTTLGDGTFELLGVRTVNDVMVVAQEPLSFTCIAGECGGVFTACQDAAPCEVPFVGIGGPQEPVRGGVTELGDIVIEGTSQPLVMTGVVARPWTFTAFESVGGGAPVSEMSGVMARPWTFTSFDSVGGGAPVSEISGVVARPWTFTSFDSAGGGALVSEMSGVVARPWTFTSFDSAGGEAPVSVMTGVVARPWTFVSEDPP